MNRLYLAVVYALLLGSCGSMEVQLQAPLVNEVPLRSKFVIKLPEDHSKGNNWQLLQDYDNTVIQQVNEVWHGNEKGIYFHLRALAVGQSTLQFINRNYSDTIDYKAFIIKVLDR